jgi:hypothetical protein
MRPRQVGFVASGAGQVGRMLLLQAARVELHHRMKLDRAEASRQDVVLVQEELAAIPNRTRAVLSRRQRLEVNRQQATTL